MRILIVDDEPAMHESYRRSFASEGSAIGNSDLDAMAAELFGDAGDDADPSDDAPIAFECVHLMQGLDAVEAVDAALGEGDPFAVAFIDVRMPPGIDGKETARRIRELDPEINLVIVTGYSDHTPLEIARVAGPTDKIFYIAKPFEVEEIVHTAHALCHRWQSDRALKDARAQLADKIDLLEEQKLELAANESRAVHLANHDSLTEAPNRLAFLRALSAAVRSDCRFAMAMLDLDRFKLVNDTLGHLAGDELIREVYAILDTHAPDEAMVARLGGDEFAILMEVLGEDDAVMTCERLIRAVSTTFKVFGHSVQAGASMGLVVVEPGEGRDPIDVMRRADLALNEAKRGGRGIVRPFDESMDESIRFRREVETGLGQAIANGELDLVFQPIVARDALEVVGFEALVRWVSPQYGVISPTIFIPIAEESNLIHELGDWVIDAAVAAIAQWPDQYVSVNFSPRQFRRTNFVGHIVERVQQRGVSPARFQIEITETAIFDNIDRAADTLYRLRQMGFRVALDDFGTGYSSLYNIRRFSLDCLKIDRSFVDGMGRERQSAAIVHSVIHLGRALGMEVIAEGVETAAQIQALRVAGCSHMQGFYLGVPMNVERATALAQQRFLEDYAGMDTPGQDAHPEGGAGNGTSG